MQQLKKDILLFKNPYISFLLAGSFLVGLFNEPAGALCSIVLTVFLVIRLKEKKAELSWSLTTICVALISFSFLLSVIWAKDKYYAFLGFVKFFPLLLFYLNISNAKDFDSQEALIFIPYSATLMTIVSYILSKVDSIAYLFSVDGRISGFFQYPNSFALFLIIGIIVLAFKEKPSVFHYIMMAIMVFGIFMSGSRTSFVIFALTVIALIVLSKDKRFKWITLGITVAMVIAAVVILFISNRRGAFGRFLSISLTSGTFNARLLYIKDALKQIIKHPFGIGYMSYYFTQGSFQTGLYTNRFIHNELLQLMIDVGWVPAAAALCCAVRAFISKKNPVVFKIILAAIIAHAMLDFDLQFLIIGFIALICIRESEENKSLKLKPVTKKLSLVALCIICALGIYFGASSSAFLLGKYEAAVKICKHNTMAQIELLNASRDVAQSKNTADIIMENNRSISSVYFAIADYYYQNGELEKFVENAIKSISLNRYNPEVYKAYSSRLITAARFFENSGDKTRLKYCVRSLRSLEDRIERANEFADPLSKYLPDHTAPGLDQQTIEEINRLERALLL